MLTIKLPYNSTNSDFYIKLKEARKQYTSSVHYSYNRILDENNSVEILNKLNNQVNNIGLLSGFIKLCAISEAKQLAKRFKNKKDLVFGGKKNFILRCQNKLSKQEYQDLRLLPLNIQGDNVKRGNRHFKLDIIDNNQIIFKLNRKEHFILHLPKCSKNYLKLLQKLEELNNKKQGEAGYTYSVKLTEKYIHISFEEFKNDNNSIQNQHRYIGIDLNPDTIGISILDSGTVIYAQEFSLAPIFNKILNSNLSSNAAKMKYYQNKLKFETFHIAKTITNLAKHYQCQTVFIEDLKFKQKVANKYNKLRNRKCKNLWKRELFIRNLTKRLTIENIKLHTVNPAYSSFIGNLQHDYTDAINASIEIARRGYEYRILKNKTKFYPPLLVKHQWKELATNYTDWKSLYFEITKNLKLKYRVSLQECKFQSSVFRHIHKKSYILLYKFL